MTMFPMFVKLDGRRVLLVGAGQVGESKVAGLLAAGASVTVVAPTATEKIRQLAEQGALQWHAREFEPRDLDDVVLAVAAVPEDVARAVYAEARLRHLEASSRVHAALRRRDGAFGGS